VGGLSAATAHAQTTPQKESTTHSISDQDTDLLRKDLRSKRKQLIAANLKLTDTEAAKFWPVYDQYIAQLIDFSGEDERTEAMIAFTWFVIVAADIEGNMAKANQVSIPYLDPKVQNIAINRLRALNVTQLRE
jgi:hypothetical protein